jgi:hypothetical protein
MNDLSCLTTWKLCFAVSNHSGLPARHGPPSCAQTPSPVVPVAAADTLRYAWPRIAYRSINSAAGADFSGWIAEETDRLQYGWASTVAASRFGERRFRPDMRCSESSDIAVAASRLHFAAD